MEFTLNKESALAVMRWLRSDRLRSHVLRKRCDIIAPDPAPLKRWSKNCLKFEGSGLPEQLCGAPVSIAVPNASMRVRTQGVTSTVYSKDIPKNSFISIGNGVAISSPELLFAEMVKGLHPVQALLLGHELCGTFSRDALNPFNGPISYGLPPLTSVEKIGRFLDEAKNIAGIKKARKLLAYLNDNAWSPTESVIAAFLRLPMDSLGYGFGELVLNPRVYKDFTAPGAKESRVPDALIAGTSSGFNYDGLVHLDVDPIVSAAFEMGANPGAHAAEVALSRAIAEFRAKAVDDIRRNRELALNNLDVIPVVKEDLYIRGGLDQIAMLLIESIERKVGHSLVDQRRILKNKALAKERYRLLLSLLPGKHERNVQVGRFIYGHPVAEGMDESSECWIEL